MDGRWLTQLIVYFYEIVPNKFIYIYIIIYLLVHIECGVEAVGQLCLFTCTDPEGGVEAFRQLCFCLFSCTHPEGGVEAIEQLFLFTSTVYTSRGWGVEPLG